MPDHDTTIGSLRQAWADFVAARDWGQFHSPKNLVMALSVEVAELMEHFLWIDNAASHEIVRDPAVRDQVADEIADVTGAVLALCNALDLDLSEAVRHKMAKNERKYPVEKARGKYRIEE